MTARQRRLIGEMWPLVRQGVIPTLAAARVGLGRKTYLRLREEHPEIAEAEQAALADYVLTHLQGLGEIARGERKGAWQAHAWAIERVVPAYRIVQLDLSKISTEQLLQLLHQLKQ